MKIKLLALVASLTLISGAFAAEGTWLASHPAALAKAKAEKKLLLMDFTGSDWCSWCIKLHKEVFSKDPFVDYAKENLVLEVVDFPNGKKLPKAQQSANDSLAKKYNIEGYPTIIVLNSEGKKVGQLGYMEGGPAKFIAELNKLKAK
jgi:thioredoxin-related protein